MTGSLGEKEILQWLEELVARDIAKEHRQTGFPAGSRTVKSVDVHYDVSAATTWITEAQAALEAGFPRAHAVLKRWEAVAGALPEKPHLVSYPDTVDALRAVVVAARDQVKAGRLGSFADAVRAETVSELLDQADTLCSAGDVIAATVIAGGALETHLLHLCTRHNIPFAGDGSISSYEGAIAKARNAGTITLYDKSDSKHVTAWGGMRNDAAHDPLNFTRAKADVSLMIEGIRQFVSRTK